MEPLFSKRNIDLTFDAGQDSTLRVNHGRLAQVIRILLDNALKHTPPGDRVTTIVERIDQRARITIHDSGEGIAPEHLERVFDRFYRVDRARSRASGGTGLGLPIARGIVEAHGGDLRLESSLGKGSMAKIMLPIT